MELDVLLTEAEPRLLDEACSSLRRCGVRHYEAAGEAITRQRLAALFALVVGAIRSRDLAGLGAACEGIAVERFNQGFGICEVQSAFNSLEQVMWRHVVETAPPADVPDAVALLSTVVGFGKDALARQYVSLASRRHAPALDVAALAAGLEW